MDQIIGNFDKVIVNKKGSPSSRMFVELGTDQIADEGPLVGKNLYNGDILGCVLCKQIDGDIVLECHRFKFFDIILNKIKPEYFPQMVNVNAIIELKDQNNEEYILFIKRPEDVYAYPGYWDFPAGLVPFDTPPVERLKDRIQKDLNIQDTNQFIIPNEPSFLVSRGKFLSFYYKIQSTLSKEQLKQELEKNNNSRDFLLLKKSQISDFLESTEKIYPVFLREVF